MSVRESIDAARKLLLAGDIAAARRTCEAALLIAADPGECSGAQLLLAECSRRSGDLQGGLEHARSAVAAAPDDAAARYLLARCVDECGDKAAAIDELRKTIERHPEYVPAHRYLGALLLATGDAQVAIHSLGRVVQIEPGDADDWNELGTALHSVGRLEEAEAAYRRAMSIRPNDPNAACNLSLLQRERGHADEAEQSLRAAIAGPNLTAAARPVLSALADIVHERGDLDQAARLYLTAAKLAPAESAADMQSLGQVLSERGDRAQARKAYHHALRLNPRLLRTALSLNLTLPIIYSDAAHVAQAREEYIRGLEILERELEDRIAGAAWAQIADGLVWSNFHLAYQGENDKELQERYATLLARALDRGDPAWRAPLQAKPVTGRKIRIGFVSSLLRKGTVGLYFGRWLTDLDRERFELCVYPLGGDGDALTAAVSAQADRARTFYGGDARPSVIAQALRAEQLDILVYPELGMEQVSFVLAAMRLAPRQYAAWGHPVTTGHATIDAFFSCEAMEPQGAQSHYTEQLILLPGIGTRFARPPQAAAAQRETLGLPHDAVLLLCPQSLFKIHPDNDTLFARVLSSNPHAILVLFAAPHPAITDQFMSRLQKCFDDFGIAIRERTRVLPRLDHQAYLAVNRVCDAMLDTLRWSGGQTSVDALDCGLPLVTLPGAMMRARQSAGMLKLIGMEKLIAKDIEDYLRIANRLCGDPPWRAQLSRQIRERCRRLFDDAEPIKALEAFYREATAPE